VPFPPRSVHAGRLLAAALLPLLAACAGGTHAPTVPHPTVPVLTPALPAEDMAYLRGRELAVPVAGVRARDVRGSFDASRGDHLHEAVDILAPRGTPVLSADDGRVWKIRSNALGGLTVYAVDPGERFVYYYAHLDGYRRGLAEGQPLAKGDTLGYVGTTGNAPPEVPHLHFQVSRIGPDRRWWTGTPVDPTPVLHDAADLGVAERRRAADRGKGVKVRKDGGR
jgi:peptidoglycan LD-endopeptidase LytH